MWWHHMHICWFLLEILKIKYYNMDPNWSVHSQCVPHGSRTISSCVLVSIPFFRLVTPGPWRCFPGNVATCTTSARDWPWHSGGSVMYPLQFHFDKKPRCKSHQIGEWSFGIYIYIYIQSMLPLSCRQDSTLKSFRSKDPRSTSSGQRYFLRFWSIKWLRRTCWKSLVANSRRIMTELTLVMVWVCFDLYKLREKKPFAENNVSECWH